MKIKCPFWNDCFVEGEMEPAQLFGHLSSEHTLGEIKHAYWELVVKIHEKIEELETVKSKSPRVITDIIEIQKILKFLLENKK